MATFVQQLRTNYDWLLNDMGDVRVKDWPMMSSPFTVISLMFVYLAFVLVYGPRYMKNRKPYDLKTIIAVYNIGQVIACTTLFYKVLTSGWTTSFSLGCQPIDYSDDPNAVKLAGLVWWTMMLKMVELIETVFFVLRKKYSQVSFLHLYHHVSTLSLAWVGTKYVAGGMATFPIMPNSLVHILMYTYYLLALFGPEVQNVLSPWKKYLTILQMVQFCILVGHSMQALAPSCIVPKFVAYIYIPNVFLVFYLFYDFYTEAYIKKDKKKA